MSDAKTALREKMRERAGSRKDAPALSVQLCHLLTNWPRWQAAATVFAFSSLPGEPDVLDPWPEKKRIALPRVEDEELRFYQVSDRADLHPGQFGILEPSADAAPAGNACDVILVPGLAFDLAGRRLGRGKGYYDRGLSGMRGFRVGICFDDQIVEEVPCEAHDLPMDAVITPAAIYLCGS